MYRFSTSRSASIFSKYISFDSKLHLVCTLKKSFSEILNSFRTRSEKLPKNYEKPLKMRIGRFRVYKILCNFENIYRRVLKFWIKFYHWSIQLQKNFQKVSFNFRLLIAIVRFWRFSFIKRLILGILTWKFHSILVIRYSNYVLKIIKIRPFFFFNFWLIFGFKTWKFNTITDVCFFIQTFWNQIFIKFSIAILSLLTISYT